MTDPIQRDKTLIEWIRNIRLEGWRQFSIWLMLGGVLLYIVGEICSTEWAVNTGIWLLLTGIALAVLYKIVSNLLAFSGKDN